MPGQKKSWWNSWVGLIVALLAICTGIAGALTWQYDTFATEEEVINVKMHAEHNVAQLSEKTLKGFEAVTETLQQLQKTDRRFDLKDSYKRLLAEKWDLLEKLKIEPNNTELKIGLDVCRSRIKMIEEELKALRISK